MHPTYQIGSRGFLVRRLQNALGITADGIYGTQTGAAVERLQQCHQSDSGAPGTSRHAIVFSPRGQAGPAEFQRAGLPWPSDYERVMNLVSCFEGTSFGDCNLRDIDGAGLTLGIAGFTTAHSEVQELIARYIACKPDALTALPGPVQTSLMELLSRRDIPAARWRRLMFASDGCVFPHWQKAFSLWGETPQMQALQLEMARERFWHPAVRTVQSLGFSSIRAKTFFFDVSVQNGGWRRAHLLVAQRMIDWHSDDERRALTAAARAVAACSREQWRNDVLARKMTIATGRGTLHGRTWHMEKFAL